MKIVITGGHHNSALPLIKKLNEELPDLEIIWYGHRHTVKGDKNDTLEYKEITELGIPFYELIAGKFYKTYNLARLAKIPFGVLHSFYLLTKHRPKLIISFGGYLAAPVVFAGYLLGIKSVTHEQTVVAGYANRIIARFVDKILLSWPQSASYYPAEKCIVTGIPLRAEVFVRKTHNFEVNPSLPTIYITAGKTGSHAINGVVKECLDVLLNTCNVIHQCGDVSNFNDYNDLADRYKGIKDNVPGKYSLRKYVFGEEIGEAFARAQMLVTRAGAHITAEILGLQKPALMVPISWVSHNEQMRNAEIVRNSGLGEILEEKDLTPKALFLEIKRMLEDISSYKINQDSNFSNVNTDSVTLIFDEIKSYLVEDPQDTNNSSESNKLKN